MQLKTAALETPDRPAAELAPPLWIKLVQVARGKPENPRMTIHDFLRAVGGLGGLGGHPGRKSDGHRGWIILWGGFEKLILPAPTLRSPEKQMWVILRASALRLIESCQKDLPFPRRRRPKAVGCSVPR